MQAALLTQAELDALCLTWQKRLRLQDWHVTVCIVPMREIDVYGTITWSIHSRSAVIGIVAALDALQDVNYHQERTLVHELLHIHFLAWDTASGTPEDTALEQAIWSISQALVAG